MKADFFFGEQQFLISNIEISISTPLFLNIQVLLRTKMILLFLDAYWVELPRDGFIKFILEKKSYE